MAGCDAPPEAPVEPAPPAAPPAAPPVPAPPAAVAAPAEGPLVSAPVSLTDPGAPLIVLDLAAGERLLDVVRPAPDAAASAALLHLGTHAGERLFAGGQRSPTWDAVSALRFLPDSGVALAEVRHLGKRAYVAWNGASFIESPRHDAVRGLVTLAGGGFAFIGAQAGREVVVRFDGQAFAEVADGSRVTDLGSSPDGRAATYGFTRTRPMWGVDARHYVAAPRWHDLGEGHVALVGQTASGAEVVVDHAVVAEHGELGAVIVDVARGQLAWAGLSGDRWNVHVANPRAATPLASVAGLPAAPKVIRFHTPSGRLQAVAPAADGERLIVGAADNALEATEVFRTVKLSDVPYREAPLALATNGEGTLVFAGATPGAAFEKVERLTATHGGSNFLYVASDRAGTRAVDATRAHPTFVKVGELLRTDGDKPVYVGEAAGGQRLVIDGVASPEVARVERVIMREGDGVAWVATLGEGQAVGLGTTLGEAFESIDGPRFSRAGTLWYDGTRAGLHHRVREAEASQGYAMLGPVVETRLRGELAWVGREVKVEGGTANGRDDVMVGGEVLARRPFSVRGEAAAKTLGATDLTSLRPVAGRDAVIHVGRLEGGLGVGLDGAVHGPFEAVRDVLSTPDGEQVAFLAQRGGTWAAQVGADRHGELSDASGLRFTPDGKEVRYDGVREETKLTFVGRDAFLAVRDAIVRPDASAWAFAGQQADGWHVSVAGAGAPARLTSEAWDGVEGLRWSQDGFGVDARVARGEARHLLRKPHGQPFAAHAAWAEVGFPRYHHAPLGAAPLGAVTGEADAGFRLPVTGLEGRPAASLFVAVGRTFGAFEATRRVRAVDADGVTLEGDLPGLAPEGRMVWVLPFEAPFTYAARQGRQGGEVYQDVWYTKIDPQGFSAHGRWLAVARGEARPTSADAAPGEGQTPDAPRKPEPADALILGPRVVPVPGRIGELVPHPDTSRDVRDTVAVAVTRASNPGSGWFVVDAEGREESLGWVSRLGLARWTELSPRGSHTLTWTGEADGRDFQAVGAERYDSVRDVALTPATGSLAWIGRRGQVEAVWAHGGHGDWFSRVRDLTFVGPADAPVHVAEHDYGHAQALAEVAGLPVERVTVLPTGRRLAAVVHGATRTGWRDAIGHVVPGDTLATTHYTAAEDGRWSLHAGEAPGDVRWEEIGWFVRTVDAAGAQHLHFLGRDGDGWVEVHDGVPGQRVDAIRGGRLTAAVPAELSPVARVAGGSDASVLVDAEGRFHYVGLVGGAQVLVHRGVASAPVRSIADVRYFADGATVAARVWEGDRVRLIVNGHVSEPWAAIGELVFAEATGDVHAVAQVALSPEVRDVLAAPPPSAGHVGDEDRDGSWALESARIERHERAEVARVKAANLVWDGAREVVLRNAGVVARAWQVVGGASVVASGTVAVLRADGAWRVYYNGAVGEAFAGLAEKPGPLFGATLGESRFVMQRDGRAWVAGADALPQGYDAVSGLYRAKVGGAEVTVAFGRAGEVDLLHVNDAPHLAAEAITNLGTYGGQLRAEVVQGNVSQIAIGTERFDAAGPVAKAAVTVEGKTWVPVAMLKDERRWLREGDAHARPAWAVWDVRGVAAGPGVRWSWLEGTLDRAAATLAVRAASMEVPASAAPTLWGPLVAESEPAVAPASVRPRGGSTVVAFDAGGALALVSRRVLVEVVQDALARDGVKVAVLAAAAAETADAGAAALQPSRMAAVADFLLSRGLPASRLERGAATGSGVVVVLQEGARKRVL